MFLLVLNLIYLEAKSMVRKELLLFERLLITSCKSSKWQERGRALILLASHLEEKGAGGCQPPDCDGKCGERQYAVCEWCCQVGAAWNWALRVNMEKGCTRGKGVETTSSPCGVPNPLEFEGSAIEVSQASSSSLSQGVAGSVCQRREISGEMFL